MFATNQPSLEEQESFVTIRDYFDDTYNFEQKALILNIINDENSEKIQIVTDRTIFHPQGGGQPKDKGIIISRENNFKFEVEDVLQKDNVILH